MRSRITAVLLLLLCVFTGAGRHTDEAASAVAATQPPAGRQDPALGQAPYDAVLPALYAAKVVQSVGGSAAVLPGDAWPQRRGVAEPAAAGALVPPAAAAGAVAPARAPPYPSTR